MRNTSKVAIICMIFFISFGGCSTTATKNKQEKPKYSQKETTALETATSCRDNGDGTMTGTDGTIWQLCLYGQTYKDGACQGSPKNISWYEAMEAARKDRFLNKNDWILPNIAFDNGSIHPKKCLHPNLGMYMTDNRYSSQVKIKKNLWTAFANAKERSVQVTDSKYIFGTNRVYYDTNKSTSDFDLFYPSVNAVFIRNAPEKDNDFFSRSLAQVKCDKKCLSERKASQVIIDNESIKRGEEFRSGAWAREKMGSDSRNSSTNERWTVLSDNKVRAVSWHREIRVRCNIGVHRGDTFTILVLDSGNYQSVTGPAEKTLSKAVEFECR